MFHTNTYITIKNTWGRIHPPHAATKVLTGTEAIGQRYYYYKAKPNNMQLLQTVIQNEKYHNKHFPDLSLGNIN